MRKRIAIAVLAGALAVPAAPAAAAPAPKVPTEAGSPWPSMRHDRRNTGSSPLRGRYHRGDRPWSFRTAKGVFSTPVVAADETVYAGSADTWFYAIGPGGKLAGATRRARSSTRPGARPGDRDLRLRRRAHLPPPHRRAAAQPPRAHALALPRHAQARRGPARELVGGQRDDGLRRQPLRGQHGRGGVLAHPAREAPLGAPGRQLGLVERRDRRRRDASTSARSTSPFAP